MSDKALSPAESRAAASTAMRVGAWGLAIYAGTRVAAVLFESASMPAAVAQAVLAEWGVGRLGVAWSDPKAPIPTTGAIARRAGLGMAVGATMAALLVVFLAATRAVLLDRAAPSIAPVAVALVTAGLFAMRDELLLHGLVMRMMVSVPSALPRVLACGVTSAAAALGDPSASPRNVAVQGLLGVVFGALWAKDRGAWAAWGAHTAWLFTTSALMQGGLYDARVQVSTWGGGSDGVLGGTAAIVALLPFAVGAVVGITRLHRAA